MSDVHSSAVIGWDIGGAHLKAAWAEDGRLRDTDVREVVT